MPTESSHSHPAQVESPKATHPQDWVEAIRQQAALITFGVIQIVVHEGRVVQIGRTEKIRGDSKN